MAMIALAFVALLPMQAAYAETTLEARASEAFNYNSNPLMSLNQDEAIYGSVTRGELTLNDEAPAKRLNLNVAVQQNLFNESSFTSTDLHGGVDLMKQHQRWTVNLRGLADYDTTRNSELSTTFVNVNNARHAGFEVAPQITFNPTPIDALSLSGSALTSHYDNDAYSDYYIATVTPGYRHNFNPRNAGTVSVLLRHYHAMDDSHITINSISPTVGWISTLSEQLTASLSGGAQTSQQRSRTIAEQPWTWGYVFAANLAFQGQVNRIVFLATREQYPFGNGTEPLLTTVSATGSHNISTEFTVGATASYQDATYQATTTGIGLKSLVTAGPHLVYHMTDRLDLTSSYLYRRETLINSGRTIEDHAAVMSLTFHPLAWRL